MRQQPAKWQTMIPLRIRAMVLAGDRLFAAGTPDVVDPDDPLAAFEGRQGRAAPGLLGRGRLAAEVASARRRCRRSTACPPPAGDSTWPPATER